MVEFTLSKFVIALCLTVFILLAYMHFQINSIQVKKYTIVIQDLPEEFQGFTILQLTDLHSKNFGREQAKLVQVLNQQSFDLVALTGDLIDYSNPDMEPIETLLSQFDPVKPIFFVPGNHELRGNYYQIRNRFKAMGVKVLENQSYPVVKGDSRLWILGVKDTYADQDRLDQALQKMEQEQSPKILLAHAPNIYPQAIESQIDLLLVGHTHGGQVRLPLIGALIAPGQGLFPKYDYGLYHSGQTQMIISGGLGESHLPIRLNMPPEIVLITLVVTE